MAGTHGIGTFGVNSKFASGSLVFYEKGVGRTATGDLLTIGTATITVGGDAQDVDLKVYLGSATEYVLYDVGNSRVDFGEDSQGVDIRIFGDTASSLLLWDTSDDRLEFDGCDLNLQDSDILQFGDAQDVAVTWNATNLVITPAVDDTGAIYFGNGTLDMDVRIHQGTTTDYVEFNVGNKTLATAGTTRLLLDGVASTGVTDGSVLRMGTSGSPLVDDQAGTGFIVGYFDSGVTSGWPAGLFISTNVTGAGGSFTALEGDAIVTVAKATCTGIESFFQFGAGGSVTGAARACQATIDFHAHDYGSGGVYSGACFNIKGEGAATDIGTTQRVSCLELKTEGTFSAVSGENFETKTAGYAIYINGFTSAGGVTNILSSTSLAELPGGTLGLRVGVGADGDAGTAYYIPLVAATAWN